MPEPRHALRNGGLPILADPPVHLDGCADNQRTGGCGRRCLCACHDEPKPRRAAA